MQVELGGALDPSWRQQHPWGTLPSLVLVTLGKALHLTGPQFPTCNMENDKNIYYRDL